MSSSSSRETLNKCLYCSEYYDCDIETHFCRT